MREVSIALVVLTCFLFAGPHILTALQISEPALRIAGGIILLLIAIKMIFGSVEEMFRGNADGEPLLVPLAVPSLAGPSAIAVVMLLTGQEPDRWPEWLLALLIAWLASSVILLLSSKLEFLFGQKGLDALQSLMGLILTALAVEMFLQGMQGIFYLRT